MVAGVAIGGLQNCPEMIQIFGLVPRGGLQGSSADVGIQWVVRGDGCAVRVVVVCIKICVIFHQEKLTGEMPGVVTAGDRDAGDVVAVVVQRVKAADQLVLAVHLDAVPEKLNGCHNQTPLLFGRGPVK